MSDEPARRPDVVTLAPAPAAPAGGAPAADDAVRQMAIQQVERVRKLKQDAAAFVLGTLVLTAVWAITQYQDSGGWPSRLSDNGRPGDWNPWIFWVVLGWGFLVALDALKVHFRRPTTEAEIQREIERLKAR